MRPKVSIRLMTYNHAAYIKQAMDGIMMQRTDFEVEVVVGDDFSSDGTLDVVKEYHSSERIKIRILQRAIGDEYSRKRKELGRLYNFSDILYNCSGEYIALLDGDDYWVDPFKLQKQVDFLDKNPSFVGCYGNAFYCNDTGEQRDQLIMNIPSKAFSQEEIVKENPVLTMNLMFRNLNIYFNEGFYKQDIGDWVLNSIISKNGNIYYIDEVWAAYRRHNASVFSTQTHAQRSRNFIKTQIYINEVSDKKYENLIKSIIEERYLWLLKYDLNYDKELFLAELMKGIMGNKPKIWLYYYQMCMTFKQSLVYRLGKRIMKLPKRILKFTLG